MKTNEAFGHDGGHARGHDGAPDCRRPGGLDLTRRGLALCAFPAGGRIVDVGCGAGASVRLLRELGYEALGVDARASGADGDDFPRIRARAGRLPFVRESLHGILCECVLSLVENYARVLGDFAEVCLPGGWLLLTDLYERSASDASLPSREALERSLRDAGWTVQHFEDHTPALRTYAAQLLWRGGEDAEAFVAKKRRGMSRVHWGYGLWTAQKEAL